MPTVKSYQKQKEKEQIATNYFIAQGYSPEATAGIVGNLVYESGLNTTARGDIGFKGGDSYGIGQFRGKRLQDLKKRYGNNWTDFNNQLDFVKHELETTHKKAGDILKNTRDVYKAGQTFSDLYEIPAKKYKNNPDRQKKVNKIYSSLSGAQISNTPISDQAISNVNTYFENQPTTDVKDLAITEENVNFDVEVAEEKVKDKDIEEVQKQTAEYNFLEEYKALVNQQQSSPEPVQIEQPIQQLPQQDLTEIYNQVSQFIDTPVAQQGKMVLTDPRLSVRDNIIKPKLNLIELDDPKNFTLEYIQSPKYRERLINAGYKNVDDLINQRVQRIKAVKDVRQEGIPTDFQKTYYDFIGRSYNPAGGSGYLGQTNEIITDTQTDRKIPKFYGVGKKGVRAHELGHAENFDTPMNKRDNDQLFRRLKEQQISSDYPIEERNAQEELGYQYQPHDFKPDENKSDLNALRFLLKEQGIYDAGTQNFTKEHLKKLKSNSIKDRLLKNYKEEDLIWLMNNVAENEVPEQTNRYAQQGTTVGNLTPQQTTDVESQRQWINNWNRNRIISGTKINTNSDIPFSSDIYVDDLNYESNGREKTLGEFDNVSNRLILDTNYQSKLGIPTHEFSHRYQKYVDPSIYSKYINEPISTALQNTQGSSEYHGNVDENQAELNRLRYNSGFKPDQIITPQDLQKYNADEYNLKHFSQEQLIDILNQTAYNENTNNRVYAQGGGKIVKDNNGYWNPDNWGKSVEISSPYITMEKVKEPLIGVSNQTGERKLMTPENNYYFKDTQQVTEYPLTENEKEFLKYIAKTK